MLKLNNITKVFKTDVLRQPFVALDDVSFEIKEGSVTGFLGANGAGKTTSIKIIMDFIKATKGSVEFDSAFGKNKTEIFKKIGYLPERPYFYPNITGRDFCYYMAALCEVSKGRIDEQILKWAPRLKIDFALDRELKTYSKGMLQRIGFLVTLIHDPTLIILDEPLSGLDPIGRKDIKDLIKELKNEGKTLFFSSHIVSDVEEICHNVIFLKDGKLVYDGRVDKLIHEHIKPSCEIVFEDDGFHKIIISNEEKKSKLEELLSKNINIYSIDTVKPTLEEIFYKVRNE
jgi:ABC-2 type transport system ATP-binding protein